MYGIMNLVTRKIVASGFKTRSASRPERDKLNGKGDKKKYITVRDLNNPRGISKISDVNFKYWRGKDEDKE